MTLKHGIGVVLRDCHQHQRLDPAAVIDREVWTLAIGAPENLKRISRFVLDDPPQMLADGRLDDLHQVENGHLVAGSDVEETKMFRAPAKIGGLDDEATAW